MEIEIITTKKKLTKSIVNQMPVFTPRTKSDFEEIEVLGHILGIVKGIYKVYLAKTSNGFALIASDLYIHGNNVAFGWSTINEDLTDEEVKIWQEMYENIAKNSKQIYI